MNPPRIALFSIGSIGGLTEMEMGVHMGLLHAEKRISSDFDTRSTSNIDCDIDKITADIKKVLADDYDFILCFGDIVSSIASIEVAKMAKQPILVALDITPYVRTCLAASSLKMCIVEQPGLDVAFFAKMIATAMPQAQSMFLPYILFKSDLGIIKAHNDWMVGKLVKPLERALATHGIKLVSQASQSVAQGFAGIRAEVEKNDAVILIDGDMMLCVHDLAGQICYHNNVPLIANIPSGISMHTSFCYSYPHMAVGQTGFEFINYLLINNDIDKVKEPYSISVPTQRNLLANERLCKHFKIIDAIKAIPSIHLM